MLSGKCGLACVSSVEWRDINQNFRADLPLDAMGFDPGDLAFCYRIGKTRASEPTLLITLRGQCVFRLDVNGDHFDGTDYYRGVTHLQTRRSPGGVEDFDPNPFGVPAVREGERVDDSTYYSILSSFATLSKMDITRLNWENVPEGRRP
jgi:hypothetical protein